MTYTKSLFKFFSIGIVVVLFILFCTYRYVFNGNLSSEVSDWTAFVTIFNGVGTLLLTALNVWIVYKLTITIAEKEEQHRLFDKQKEALNHFISTVYAVFTPDVENPTCEINRDLLGKVFHKLKLMKTVYAPICKVFEDDEYNDFIEDFRGFCLDYFQEESAESEGKNMEEEAFALFMKALNLEMKIGKEMNTK